MDALTKKGHAVFTDDDYAKLQAILSDKNSLLEQLEPDHVVSPDRTALDVDDVTAATPVSLGNAVVSGSVYTCYTLWHWANGEVVEQLAPATSRQTRTLYLAALSQIPLPPPAGYYDRISRWLPQMDTYFEVHLLLTLLEEEDAGSPEVVKHSMMVLENENFLIARRAFWFLDKQSLATSQREKVEAFRAKHEDRL